MTASHPSIPHSIVEDLPHWREEALCRHEAVADLFFPGGDRGQTLMMTNAAKKVCRGCAVRIDCLLYAIETKQQYGVWGAMTESERLRLRHKLGSARSPDAVIEILAST